MDRKKFKKPELDAGEIVKRLMLAGIVVAGALLCICHASCQLTSQGIQALDAEEGPQITGACVLSASSIEVDFSKEVSVQSASVSRLSAGERASIDMAAENPIAARAAMSRDGRVAVYVFEKGTELGERYQLLCEIKDARGNSLTFALPFDGFNERLPKCALVEVQPKKRESSKTTVESSYVTIKALEDGNLFGLDLHCAKKDKTFVLPKVEVKAGEEITLHLSKAANEDDCVDELGENVALAKTWRSSNARRDLFFDLGTSIPINESDDAIFLRDRNANKVVDALTYFKTGTGKDLGKISWNYSEAMQKAVSDKAWEADASLESAMPADGYTPSKPLVRTKIPSAQNPRPSSKYDWEVYPEKSVYANVSAKRK